MAGQDAGGTTGVAAARRALHVAIGARVREVRMRVGLGQAECARGAGIDISSMFRIEKGEQNLTADTLGRLAISLGVNMEELLGGVVPQAALIAPRSRG